MNTDGEPGYQSGVIGSAKERGCRKAPNEKMRPTPIAI
jgi:hypothetical protein